VLYFAQARNEETGMASPALSPVYDYFLTFVVERVTPQEILAFEVPEKERRRAIELLDRQDAGTLSPEEAAELEQMCQVDRLISALKARALAASEQA
jgi:uncharacterized protein YciU (UPF0263 family)